MKQLGLIFVLLLVFFIPCEGVAVIPGVGTVSKLVGILSFTICLLAIAFMNRIRSITAVHWILLAFLMWSLLTYVWSINPEQSLARCWTYGQLMVMVWLLWQWTQDSISITRVFMAYVAGAYVSIGFTFYNYLSHKQVVWQRYSATGFDPNELGLILVLGIPLSWYVAQKTEKIWQIIVFRFYFIAAASAIVLTASRMAVITAIIASLFILFTFGSLSNRTKIMLVTACLCLLPVIIAKMPGTSFTRIASIGKEVSTGTLNNRRIIWGAGFTVLADELLLGTGIGTFPTAVKPYLKEAVVAHNTYLTILVEQGVIGFILFMWFLLYVTKGIFSMPKVEKILWLTILSAWGIGVATLTWDGRKTTWLILILCIAHKQLLAVKKITPSCLPEVESV